MTSVMSLDEHEVANRFKESLTRTTPVAYTRNQGGILVDPK